MSLDRHDIQWENVGAYLLGALTEIEQRGFERHLEECHVCRDEVERLRPAADALPRSVAPLAAPPSLKEALMGVVEADLGERERERRPALPGPVARVRERLSASLGSLAGGSRPKAAWVSASIVLLVGVLAGYAVTQVLPGGDPRTLSASVDRDRVPFGSGSLTIPGGEDDGAILHVNGMPALESNRTYQVWVLRDGAAKPQDSLFTVGEDGQGNAVVTDDLKHADAVLVTREPAGGARAPSEKPILRVSL